MHMQLQHKVSQPFGNQIHLYRVHIKVLITAALSNIYEFVVTTMFTLKI